MDDERPDDGASDLAGATRLFFGLIAVLVISIAIVLALRRAGGPDGLPLRNWLILGCGILLLMLALWDVSRLASSALKMWVERDGRTGSTAPLPGEGRHDGPEDAPRREL